MLLAALSPTTYVVLSSWQPCSLSPRLSILPLAVKWSAKMGSFARLLKVQSPGAMAPPQFGNITPGGNVLYFQFACIPAMDKLHLEAPWRDSVTERVHIAKPVRTLYLFKSSSLPKCLQPSPIGAQQYVDVQSRGKCSLPWRSSVQQRVQHLIVGLHPE